MADFLLCLHKVEREKKKKKRKRISSFFNKATILSGYGPTLMTSFNLKLPPKDPVLKYNHIGVSAST